jgi:predicted nuclease of predicted toxin-antitoxin system
MKLLANENFPYLSKEILAKEGFDIIYIGQECSGIKDEEVMELAMSEERLILTFDQDYGTLIFKDGYRPPQGVVFFRWDEFSPDEPANFLIELFKNKEVTYNKLFTVIDKNNIRQRKY